MLQIPSYSNVKESARFIAFLWKGILLSKHFLYHLQHIYLTICKYVSDINNIDPLPITNDPDVDAVIDPGR